MWLYTLASYVYINPGWINEGYKSSVVHSYHKKQLISLWEKVEYRKKGYLISILSSALNAPDKNINRLLEKLW